ncbi:MAG: hypothetical protein P0116_14325 [Candidatus Nitrosocosmicus sp.]|nr:hypothetical protein [Candidatus Nitrosocosmicus sp.]
MLIAVYDKILSSPVYTNDTFVDTKENKTLATELLNKEMKNQISKKVM